MTPQIFRSAIAHMNDDTLAEIINALGRSRQTSMEQIVHARAPECGLFGDIAQDLDASLAQIRDHGNAPGASHKLVIIESPYAAMTPEKIAHNETYARACLRDSLERGEAPIASHLLYTQPGVLRDEVPEERQWGIDAGLAWRLVAQMSAVYTDLGISRGMTYGIQLAHSVGIPVEERALGADWAARIAAE